GNIVIDPATMATSQEKVFAGGSLRRGCEKKASPIFSISDGRIAAASMDRFLQDASLTANRKGEGPFESRLYTNIEGVQAQPRVAGTASAGGYTQEEAAQEAGRCMSCECMECVKACEYLKHYGSYPRTYAREIYNNLSIAMGIHRANRMINTCSLCGLCENICPGKLDMGEICQEARQIMVKKGKMPPSHHDFGLRDMDFS
ncbi:MAG TPA: amine oxidase, partial [Pelotomaculum sp.]|nr:amine oxidase [Pelotomaculum sp.]